MYPINNASIYDDNSVTLPLGTGERKKRKFTLWFDSTGGTPQPYSTNVFQGGSEDQTFAMKYRLPLNLKSRTGFFDVCLKSMLIGINPLNKRYVKVGATPGFIETFLLNNSSFKFNIQGSSAYNGYQGDSKNSKEIEQNGVDVQNDYVASTDAYNLGTLQPIGSFQVKNNGNSVSVNTEPGRASDAIAATEDTNVSFANLNNIPAVSTRCDDVSVTLPDSVFAGDNIFVVLSTIGSYVIGVDADGVPNDVERYSVPLLFNPTVEAPTDGVPASYVAPYESHYKPFNLPYSFCLQFTESDDS